MINVHLVCHTHDDAGWLKTVDQYFYGTNRSITKDTVRQILDTVFEQLEFYPNRKFSYAESSFFSKWWDLQDDLTRHKFKKLVNQGQFEFIGGGWVQHDEASTHYAAMIDQMTLGHRFLNTTFGKCGIPKIGWQIDPFGHSRENAALFAMMNFEALFFARIHYLDRNRRQKDKSMEMTWHGSDDLGKKADIMTGVFYEHYMPPDGFCFDTFCADDPFVDDTRSDAYNVDTKVDNFLKFINNNISKSYATNHVMLTMGGDFHFSNAHAWFSNLDKLIMYVNARQTKGSNVNVFYSTPSCYARAVSQSEQKLPEKFDDFFPYANDVHSYWTGYFTSRPTFKGYVRETSNLFQVCQSLDAIAQLDPLDWGDVDVLHHALGIMQHHDAVSGTAKQHVTNDYAKMLHQGLMACQQVANDAMKYLASFSKQPPPYHSLCVLLNETVCNVSQTSDKFLVTIHNGLSKQYLAFVRIPVESDSYKVLGPDGKNIQVQIIKISKTPQLAYQAPFELVFPVELVALGFNTFYVEKLSTGSPKVLKRTKKRDTPLTAADYAIENELLLVQFDASTGRLKSIFDKRRKIKTEISQNFLWYRGTDATLKNNQPSGAYIFRPNGTQAHFINGGNVQLKKVQGPHVQEIVQIFSPWVTQRVRLIRQKPYVEFEWTIGPIPSHDNISREIISRFDTTIQSNGSFFTDSNGRQMMRRTRNLAPTYDYSNSEPISGNYYPVNTRIYIKDSNIQMTILTDRTQGGSSLADGSIELMVHRRLLQDDYFGVEEPLNETGTDGHGLVAIGRHWLMLEAPNVASKKHRFYAMEMFYKPILTFSSFSDQTFDQYRDHFKTTFAGLTTPLPQNVHILTLAQWRGTSMLLRFEHLFQNDEDHEYSRSITLSLHNLFTTFDIVSMREVSLSASEFSNESFSVDSANFSLTLQPMEIRSFLCEIQTKRRSCPTNNARECLS